MALAVAGGLRAEPGAALRRAALPRAGRGVYVEVFRGTPVLLQLYVLYYGLAPVLRARRVHRGGARPRPQLRGLRGGALPRRARGGAGRARPRRRSRSACRAGRRCAASSCRRRCAWRCPAIANDFIALLKDSSLVSVITVVELTKQMTITAVDVRSWLVPGLLCAALYLALSLPLGAAGAAARAPPGACADMSERRAARARPAHPARRDARSCAASTSSVGRGEVVAIVGPSGGGKTTLLRALNYLTPFDAGEVEIAGLTLRPGLCERRDAALLRAVRQRVGMVFQQLPPVPAPDRARQRRRRRRGACSGCRAEAARRAGAERCSRASGSASARRRVPARALRRPAAARGHRARAGDGAGGAAARRADLGARPAAATARCWPSCGDLAAARADDGGRDARDRASRVASRTASSCWPTAASSRGPARRGARPRRRRRRRAFLASTDARQASSTATRR